jgi:hypothetical protein
MFKDVLLSIFDRYHDLLVSPIHNPEMVWILLPLLIIIAMMTFYFAKYKEEELGWNTALGNSLIIIFVSIDLFRRVFFYSNPGSIGNFVDYIGATLLVFLFFLIGIALIFINFSHVLPKKIAYFISSPLVINLSMYVLIIVIYAKVPIDIITLFVAVVLFVLLLLLFTGIGMMASNWWEKVERMKEKEEVEDVRKEKKVLEKTKKIVKDKEQKIKLAKKKKEKEVKLQRSQLKKIKKTLKR